MFQAKSTNGFRKRQRFQFSLKTLFILTTVLSLLFSHIGRRYHSLATQAHLQAELEKRGACVTRALESSTWLDWPVDSRYGYDVDWIYFIGPDVSDNDIAFLASCRDLPGLENIHIQDCRISDSAVSSIASLLQIKGLAITDTPITDIALVNISRLTNIEWLDLSNTRLSDDGFKHLSALIKLVCLDVGHTAITGEGFRYLTNLPELQSVDARGTTLTEEGLYRIAQINSIEKLYIAECHINKGGLRHLNNLKQLRILDLTDTAVTVSELAQLCKMPSLYSEVRLKGLRIRDSDLPRLRLLQSSCSLYLTETDITDAGVEYLKKCTSLQLVYLTGTKVSEDAAKSLSKALNIPVCINGKAFVSGVQKFGMRAWIADRE